MKGIIFGSVTSVSLALSAWADEASHRKSMMELLGLMDMRTQIKLSFLATLEPVFERSRKSGSPQALTEDLRDAMSAWIMEENRMSELETLTCDLYMKELGEDDTNNAINLFKMPGGAKLLQRLQIITIKNIELNNKFFDSKEVEMQRVVLSVIDKHKPKPAK